MRTLYLLIGLLTGCGSTTNGDEQNVSRPDAATSDTSSSLADRCATYDFSADPCGQLASVPRMARAVQQSIAARHAAEATRRELRYACQAVADSISLNVGDHSGDTGATAMCTAVAKAIAERHPGVRVVAESPTCKLRTTPICGDVEGKVLDCTNTTTPVHAASATAELAPILDQHLPTMLKAQAAAAAIFELQGDATHLTGHVLIYEPPLVELCGGNHVSRLAPETTAICKDIHEAAAAIAQALHVAPP